MKSIVHTFLSYSKSHIYEIHACCAATITFFIMFKVKIWEKRKIREFFEQRTENDIKWKEKELVYIRRLNTIVLITAFLLAFFLFTIISWVSPMIRFSWKMGLLSGAFTLTEYAVYDQFKGE